MATSKTKVETKEINGVSNEDALFAHEALRVSGMSDEVKERVNHIYRTIFNEEIKHSCCKNRAYNRMDHYVRNVLKVL
jgi:hypothetical protein